MHPVSKVKALGGATQRADMMYYRLATDCLFFEIFARRQAEPALEGNLMAALYTLDTPQAPRSGADLNSAIFGAPVFFEHFGRRQANLAVKEHLTASLYSWRILQALRGADIDYTMFGVPTSGPN
ncbi:hypothetical protein B0H15DRAFT_800144 [Mycena belliarum]|uniref:Uncharacterized protein n=1 Tax=Mycena belliarum TaxID=1033014 RepID=A0AAD6UAQ3_9AGAR|nr:hypothetical protein B0H15DRAFT_800144 [Mycena belliae]